MKKEISKYCRERFLMKCILVIVNVLLAYLLLESSLYFIIAAVCIILLVTISWMLFIVINTKRLNRFDYILLKDCDSELFYNIYKGLNKKYPKDATILQKYCISLFHGENNDIELTQVIESYKNYKSHIFYLRANYLASSQECKDEKFLAYYNSIKSLYDKKYEKTKNATLKDKFLFVEAERLFLDEKYDESLKIYQSLLEADNNFDKVVKEYAHAKCLLRLGRKNEAIDKFNYVIKYGNTLRICNETKKIIHEIEIEGSI